MPDGVNATASATSPRRRRTAATAASVAGVFGFGLAAGVLLGSPVLAPTEVPVDSGASAQAPLDVPSAATVMPDLLAMPEDAARQAIA